jgi:hypothetical protein
MFRSFQAATFQGRVLHARLRDAREFKEKDVLSAHLIPLERDIGMYNAGNTVMGSVTISHRSGCQF